MARRPQGSKRSSAVLDSTEVLGNHRFKPKPATHRAAHIVDYMWIGMVAESAAELSVHVPETGPVNALVSGEQKDPGRFHSAQRQDKMLGPNDQWPSPSNAHGVGGNNPVPLWSGLKSPEAYIIQNRHVGALIDHRDMNPIGGISGSRGAELTCPTGQTL